MFFAACQHPIPLQSRCLHEPHCTACAASAPHVLPCTAITGTMSPGEVEASYRISRRIEGEERALDAAGAVFVGFCQFLFIFCFSCCVVSGET